LSDSWVVILTPSARRDVGRLDRQVKRRVEDALDRVAADPAAAQLRRLKNRPELRLRVGDWRVLLEFDHPRHEIVILHVLRRDQAYRD
jgi:mRNA interferase RelE/StbE